MFTIKTVTFSKVFPVLLFGKAAASIKALPKSNYGRLVMISTGHEACKTWAHQKCLQVKTKFYQLKCEAAGLNAHAALARKTGTMVKMCASTSCKLVEVVITLRVNQSK